MFTSHLISKMLPALFLLLLPGMQQSAAQEGPAMKWGEIDTTELRMNVYLPDTSAHAVVLFDHGQLEFNDDVGFTLRRHKRIKIFSKEGYDQATEIVSIYSKDGEEKIKGIEGVTYVPGPDGSVKEIEMDDDAIFKEDYDKKHTRYRFTLPALQPGCIVEYRYVIIQKHVFSSREWEFQSDIPELWSDFEVVIPKTFAFAIVKQGLEKFFINEKSDVKRYYHGALAGIAGIDGTQCTGYRYVLKNAPAVRDEPFMTTPDDYRQKLSLQLAEYITPYTVGVVTVMKTWKTFVQEMVDDKEVGKAVDDTKDVRNVTEPLIANLSTPEDKIQAIYDYVRKNIVWSGEYRWWVEKDVDDVLESRSGSAAEITTLLLSMLKVAGINGCPVILSTRANGMAQDVYPIANQYNYSLACAFVGTKQYFLDATDPARPINVLPTRVLNTRGLLIRPESVDWVTLTTGVYYHHEASASMTLSENGELKGTVETVDKDYAALSRRHDLKDEKATEVVKHMLGADRALVTVDSALVSGLDSSGRPLGLLAMVDAPSYAEPSGDRIYFNPFFVERQYDNPFKVPTRKYPIDMSYPQEFVWDYTIMLPEGYDVKELPKNQSASVRKDAGFSRTCRLEGRKLTMHASLTIPVTQFSADSYNALKDFYEQITAIESEQLVLQKHMSESKPSK